MQEQTRPIYAFDLHTHTTTSDGKLSWKELLAYAKQCGLEGIAITDHNTVGPITEIAAEAKRIDIEYIPGTEIKTSCAQQIADWKITGRKLIPTQELIIYGINPNNAEFAEMSLRHLQGKAEYVRRLCEVANSRRTSDISDITFNEPITLDSTAIIASGGNYVGAANVVDALLKEYQQRAPGLGKNQIKEFLDKCRTQIADVLAKDPFYSLDVVEAVTKAKTWGKLVFLAHPFTKSRAEMGEFYVKNLIPQLVQNGLDGVESCYPEHTPEQIRFLDAISRKYGLIQTGGSDFHSEKNETLGNYGVTPSIFRFVKRLSDR